MKLIQPGKMTIKKLVCTILAAVLIILCAGCGSFTEVEKSLEDSQNSVLEESTDVEEKLAGETGKDDISQKASSDATKATTKETTTVETTTTRPERYIKVVYYADIVEYLPISQYEGQNGWLDDSAIWDYVINAADRYNTYVADANYFLSDGAYYYGATDLHCADYYGYYIDKYTTHDYIYEAVKAGEDTTVYVEWCGIPSGVYGWGSVPDTYIAISIDYQFAWFFRDGCLYEATNVVTGLPTESRATPTGVFSVLNMDLNANLKGTLDGESWDETVNYWMGVTSDGVGIHDAHWRGVEQWNYGGYIYQYNGSHGCINIPYYSMQNIWNNSYIGMTVIIY